VLSHYHREITGEGQQVDVSQQEVAASRTSINQVLWQFDKILQKRNGPARIFGIRSIRWIWPCKDGNVFWRLMGAQFGAPANRALSKWIDDDGMENPLKQVENWENMDMAVMTEETQNDFEAAIARLFMNHTKKEIAEEGLKRGVNLCVLNNPADVLEHSQLKARDYWANLEYPWAERPYYYPRHFFLSSETDNYVKHLAPLIGEHNDEIYNQEMGLSSREIAELKEADVI
jgi:crotonobetainyl-CoA:carnitine CoA-transferase CaiB-like acyl-CoA transferase